MAKLFSGGPSSPMGHQVDKATSSLLLGPDWGSNMDICDAVNTDPGKTRDVVKAIKKRLQHKDPKVQLLTLTLLETMMKNCGEYVHSQVAEKEILAEMVKIVKKKSNMQVRERILELLDVWQEAFGGPSGRYRQYWGAYDELRRTGVSFPPRRQDASPPIYMPRPPVPAAPHQPVPSYNSPSYGPSYDGSPMPGQPSNDPQDPESMSLADINSARSSLEVLAEMLSAVEPGNKQAMQDDIIVDLVEQCRTNQRRVMGLINGTGDEEVLRQGLALNDELQKVLSKHEALETGAPVPTQAGAPAAAAPPPPPPARLARFDHEEGVADDDDDFADQLRPRPSAKRAVPAVGVGGPAAASGAKPSLDLFNKASVDLLSGESAAGQPPSFQASTSSFSPYGEAVNPSQDSYSSHAQSNALPPGVPALGSAPPSGNPYQYQQQQQEQARFAHSSSFSTSPGIRPIPAPPGQPSSQRVPLPAAAAAATAVRQQAMPPPPSHPQVVPPAISMDSSNPFDEGNYSAPTFQATATPSPPPPPAPSFQAAQQYASPPQQPQQPQQQFGRPAPQVQPYGSPFPIPQSQSQQYPYPSPPPQHQPQQYAATSFPPQQQQYPGFASSFAAQAQGATPGFENTYVAPWAMASQQQMSEQQRALIYGAGASPANQQAAQAAPGPASWSAGQANGPAVQHVSPGSSSVSPQQAPMLYSPPPPPGSSSGEMMMPLALPPPQQGAQMPQLGSSSLGGTMPPLGYGADLASRLGGVSLGASTASFQEKPALAKPISQPAAPRQLTPQQLARNEDPMQSLFGDLVDLRSSRDKLVVKGGTTSSGPMSAGRLDGRS